MSVFRLCFAFLFLVLFNSSECMGQLEKVIVEKYYISGPDDTIRFDEDIEPLADSSITYRIYLDLSAGSSLVDIFGTADHPFRIESTRQFFNHTKRGQSFGDKINEKILDNNTVALDSWLSLGQATRVHRGVLKTKDPDGSLEEFKTNLDGALRNEDPGAGIPLVEADGLAPRPDTLIFTHSGVLDIISSEDSTIFGGISTDTLFMGSSFALRADKEIKGLDSDNIILIAQVTTSGELTFTLNATIRNENGNLIRYVGKDTLVNAEAGELFSSWLTYPFKLRRGCMNPYFAQYDPLAVEDDGSCRDSVIFGCMDPESCSFNPLANVNLPDLCCYDSKCALDLSVACPGIVYGCMDPEAVNYNPLANRTSPEDACCYRKGCMNEDYLEYDRNACFQDSTSCRVLKIEGCTDSTACNYNPFANVSRSICEYESCIDSRKNSEINTQNREILINLYPNPVNDFLCYSFQTLQTSAVTLQLYNSLGVSVFHYLHMDAQNNNKGSIEMKDNEPGVYILKISQDGHTITRKVLRLP